MTQQLPPLRTGTPRAELGMIRPVADVEIPHVAVRMPGEGRVVREAYPARVANALARSRLGWAPRHAFQRGVERTGDWLRFARLA